MQETLQSDQPVEKQSVENDKQKWRRTFVLVLALYLAVLAPILWANRYKLEDWRRLIRGSYGWTGEGRPVTDFLVWVLNLGGPLLDTSPLQQILGVLTLAAAATLVARRFQLRPLQAALALLPLAGSPYFLENLASRFDALAICLSVALALLPIALSFERQFLIEAALGGIFLLLSLCSYQTGINVFLVFCVTELAWRFSLGTNPRIVGRAILLRASQLILSLFAYWCVARIFVTTSYNVEHVRLISRIQDLHILQENWRTVWSGIYSALPGPVRNIFLVPLLAADAVLVVLGMRYARVVYSQAGLVWALVTGVAVALLPFIWLVASVGPLLLPVHAVLTLPRIFVGTGGLLAAAFIVLCLGLNLTRIPGKVVCGLLLIPAYPLLMLAVLFGNVQREQAIYEARIASELSSTIETVRRSQPVAELIVDGVVPYCPIVRLAVQKYRILRVFRTLDSDRDHGIYTHHIFEYYGIDLPYETSPERRAELIQRANGTKPLVSNGDYDLFFIDGVLIVRFFGDSPLVYPKAS